MGPQHLTWSQDGLVLSLVVWAFLLSFFLQPFETLANFCTSAPQQQRQCPSEEKQAACALGAGRTRGLRPTALGHMVTPSHSSLLNCLSDALNHCPDLPAMQALAGKQIATHRSEFFTSFSLQTS